jgi:hypothetical protein
MVKALDYDLSSSSDSRFDSWYGQIFFSPPLLCLVWFRFHFDENTLENVELKVRMLRLVTHWVGRLSGLNSGISMMKGVGRESRDGKRVFDRSIWTWFLSSKLVGFGQYIYQNVALSESFLQPLNSWISRRSRELSHCEEHGWSVDFRYRSPKGTLPSPSLSLTS